MPIIKFFEIPQKRRRKSALVEKKSAIKRCGASSEAGFFGISIVLKGPLAAFDSFLFLFMPNKPKEGMVLELA